MSWEAAPVCSTIICFASLIGLPCSLVRGDLVAVCPLIWWGDLACLLNPYPLHYRGAFAFSTFLYPHLHRLPLRVAFPMPGEIWACHVSSQCQSGLGPSLFAGSLCVHDRRTKTSCTGSIPFWASLSASLACWPLRRLSGFRIRWPYHSILAPNRVDARSPIVLSRCAMAAFRLWLHCPRSFTPPRYRDRMSW
jgi:hypothetical protein